MPSEDSSPTGLTNAGYLKRCKTAQRTGLVRDHESRQANAMVGQHLLGERFVFAQKKSVGSGAGVAHFHQLQQRRDVGLMRAVVMEGFGQVEDHVRRAGLELFDDRRDVVENSQRLDLVAEALETFQNTRLRWASAVPEGIRE